MQFALGPDAAQRGLPTSATTTLSQASTTTTLLDHFATTPEEIRDRISVYAKIGMDELLLAPYLPGSNSSTC